MLKVFTIQMGKRFQAQKRKMRVIDTTVKSSDRLFSPTWKMVMAHKADPKEIEDDEYARLYRRMMIESWTNHRVQWEEILRSDDQIALACYCKAGAFCHRILLKDMFEELCKKLDIPFEYYGELE